LPRIVLYPRVVAVKFEPLPAARYPEPYDLVFTAVETFYDRRRGLQ
jgi:hypothetical protein